MLHGTPAPAEMRCSARSVSVMQPKSWPRHSNKKRVPEARLISKQGGSTMTQKFLTVSAVTVATAAALTLGGCAATGGPSRPGGSDMTTPGVSSSPSEDSNASPYGGSPSRSDGWLGPDPDLQLQTQSGQ